MKKLLANIKNNLPLLIVLFIGLFIALQNTSVSGYYSGWDNIHAEINLKQYATRVFYGAWQEHQGLGNPAAKGHLSEITRIPILFILEFFFPNRLIRAAFIFIMYLTGAISMYQFLRKTWINQKVGKFANWIAGLGSLFYLLHPLTLQQFYISFEMFTVQFAFFPFILMMIYSLAKRFTWKQMVFFSLLQVAIASSGHTSTVFYLGALFSVIFAFFSHFGINHKFVKAFKFSFIIGLISFAMNSYWILPNVYYAVHTSQYVKESATNILFAPEALWSIREASTLHGFLTGYHYLTFWKDYDFSLGHHDLIFNEWSETFHNPYINGTLYFLASFTILAVLIIIFRRKRVEGYKWSIVLLYIISSIFIWIELFPTRDLIISLYQSKTFAEAFRNPFTKLSILHSVFVVILFSETVATIVAFLKSKLGKKVFKISASVFTFILFVLVMGVTPNSFQGHFINERLKVIFPSEYQAMYEFLYTKDHGARALELPYFSREGWVLYDWSTPNRVNAYQGIGFYFFGMPQPFLTPDFARWSGVTDDLYQEFNFSINTQNVSQFEEIMKKYKVPLVIIDKTRIDQYRDHSFKADEKLVTLAGFEKIWEKNYLSVYEHPEIASYSNDFITPEKLNLFSANLTRVNIDNEYSENGDYLNLPLDENQINFPFTNLLQNEITNSQTTGFATEVSSVIPLNSYTLRIPGHSSDSFITTIAIQQEDGNISISFPKYSIETNKRTIEIESIEGVEIDETELTTEFIFFNNQAVDLNQDKLQYVEVELEYGDTISILDKSGINLREIEPNWKKILEDKEILLMDTDFIKLKTEFPIIFANLTKQPSENCSSPVVGSIETTYEGDSAIYKADKFGVNCNATNVSFLSPANSYLITFSGENYQGRSTKVFINYSEENSVASQFMMPEGIFSSTYSLSKTSDDIESKFFINWETRSFGNESVNKLDRMQLTPIPLERFSKISLIPLSKTYPEKISNEVEVEKSKKHSISHYSANVSCKSTCYVGINQAHDDLWLAFDVSNMKFAPHYRYNNWANIWQVNENSNKIVIFYLPQYIAFAGMAVTVGLLVVFTTKQFRKKKHTTKD